jgi:hypothetical protein
MEKRKKDLEMENQKAMQDEAEKKRLLQAQQAEEERQKELQRKREEAEAKKVRTCYFIRLIT